MKRIGKKIKIFSLLENPSSCYHEWPPAVSLARVLASVPVTRTHHLGPNVDLEFHFFLAKMYAKSLLFSYLYSRVPVPVLASVILENGDVRNLAKKKKYTFKKSRFPEQKYNEMKLGI